jgi:hypothetical protein
VLGLGDDIKASALACKEKDEPARSECLASLRKRTYDMILFRMYDLEERAEELGGLGAPREAVVALTVAVEEQKAAFVKATSKDARRDAILGARAAWKNFLTSVKPFLR